MENNVSPAEKSRQQDVFLALRSVNVNDHVEKKETGKASLTYLSWSYAWDEIRSRCPDVTYTVYRDPQGFPYVYDPRCGIMVFTSVTVGTETHEMWLPVMDGANNSMLFEPYEIQTKFGPKTIARATMFDVNKTIMRCLAKNIAMFGLGLYIYAGEDLPAETDEDKMTVAALIENIQTEIDRIKKRDGVETSEQKKKLAQEHIIPFIGSANYKMCKDVDKLGSLIIHLKSA